MATKDELAAATLLDVITCLKQGQCIQEAMQRTNVQIQQTLVAILEGQTRISQQIELGVSRSNSLERRLDGHEARISALEKGAGRPARAG
jgi:hypothetical protein